MSLSYYAEHLAWQQRVQREIINSNKFYQYHDSVAASSRKESMSSHQSVAAPSNPNLLRDSAFHHSPTKHTVVSGDSRGSSPPKSGGFRYERSGPRSMRQSKHSLNYYGPAEVRGKYARPAVNVDRLLSEAGETIPKDNPVLSRPVTSGSLVAKTRVDTGVQADSSSRPETRSKTPGRRSRKSLMDNPSRPRTANRLRTRTHSRLIADKGDLPPLPEPKVEKMPEIPLIDEANPAPADPEAAEAVVDSAQAPDADNPQAGEDSPEIPLDRPATATTWKTTSSQRRYIDELEKLLKEERKRRILAEAKLGSS